MFFATRAESKTLIRDVSFQATSFAVNYGRLGNLSKGAFTQGVLRGVSGRFVTQNIFIQKINDYFTTLRNTPQCECYLKAGTQYAANLLLTAIVSCISTGVWEIIYICIAAVICDSALTCNQSERGLTKSTLGLDSAHQNNFTCFILL